MNKINVIADLHSDMYDGTYEFITTKNIMDSKIEDYVYIGVNSDNKYIDLSKNDEKSKKYVEEIVKNTDEICENLFILGDISNLNCSSKLIIDNLLEYWKKIYIIPGNHDFYFQSRELNRYDNLVDYYRNNKRVNFVKDDIIDINGSKIGMNMMFYNVGDIKIRIEYSYSMNDSMHIEYEDAYKYYKQGIEYYNSIFNKINVFMSHVPLIPNKIQMEFGEGFKQSPFLNTSVVLDPNVYYISGHTHYYGKLEYKGIKGFSASVGYPGENKIIKAATLEF